MKILIIISFFLLPMFGYSQTDTLISFSGVVKVDGVTKDQLFQNGRQWYNKEFVSSKAVLQIVDKETGELSGKGILKSYYDFKMLGTVKKYDCYFRVSIDIKVKDGKYKYSFTEFVIDEALTPGMEKMPALTSSNKCPIKFSMVSEKKMDAMYLSMQENLKIVMDSLIANLEKEMSIKTQDDF